MDQKITVTVIGSTRGGAAGAGWIREQEVFEQEIVLDRGEPGSMIASQYRAQHAAIEQGTLNALNKVQAALARERGDDGF